MMRWLKGRGSRIFVQGWHKDNNLERNPNKTKEAIVDFNWAGNHSHTPIYTCWADLHLIKVLFPWSPHHQVLHLVSEIFSLDHKGTTVHTFVHIFKSPHIWGDLKSPTCAPGCWRKFHIVQLRAASQTASQCGTENALLQTLQSGWKLPKETFVFSYPPCRTFTGEKKTLYANGLVALSKIPPTTIMGYSPLSLALALQVPQRPHKGTEI